MRRPGARQRLHLAPTSPAEILAVALSSVLALGPLFVAMSMREQAGAPWPWGLSGFAGLLMHWAITTAVRRRRIRRWIDRGDPSRAWRTAQGARWLTVLGIGVLATLLIVSLGAGDPEGAHMVGFLAGLSVTVVGDRLERHRNDILGQAVSAQGNDPPAACASAGDVSAGSARRSLLSGRRSASELGVGSLQKNRD